jgi:dipeptidyl aminopeptidase/acylaminoacyl peptidase
MSPVKYVHKWSTPQLIIHGSKDYRIPDTEGLATFHALQQFVDLMFSMPVTY